MTPQSLDGAGPDWKTFTYANYDGDSMSLHQHIVIIMSEHKDAALRLNGTQQSVQVSDEQFAALISALKPTKATSTHAASNPLPLGIIGFLLDVMPTSVCLMRWGYTTPHSLPAYVSVYYLMGGLLLWVAGLFSFIGGQTFGMVISCVFGSFSFVLAMLIQPSEHIAQAVGGLSSPQFNDAVGAFLLVFAFFCLILTVCSLRLSVAFFGMLSSVTVAIILLGAGYLRLARSDADQGLKLFRAAGAFAWVACMFGWYTFISLMFDSVQLPITLPVGEFVKPAATSTPE